MTIKNAKRILGCISSSIFAFVSQVAIANSLVDLFRGSKSRTTGLKHLERHCFSSNSNLQLNNRFSITFEPISNVEKPPWCPGAEWRRRHQRTRRALRCIKSLHISHTNSAVTRSALRRSDWLLTAVCQRLAGCTRALRRPNGVAAVVLARRFRMSQAGHRRRES